MNNVLTTLVVIGGWIGAAEVLLAYVLVSKRAVAGDSLRYQALNISGSFLVMLNCIATGAWSSVTINVFYLAVGMTVLMTVKRAHLARLVRRTARSLQNPADRAPGPALAPAATASSSPGQTR